MDTIHGYHSREEAKRNPHLEYEALVKVLDGQHALHAVQVVGLDLDHAAQPVVDLRQVRQRG
jgi:hypothetical protein